MTYAMNITQDHYAVIPWNPSYIPATEQQNELANKSTEKVDSRWTAIFPKNELLAWTINPSNYHTDIDFLKKIPSPKHLRLSWNDQSTDPLISRLHKIPNVVSLFTDFRNTGDTWSFLGKMKDLTTLDLSQDQFSRADYTIRQLLAAVVEVKGLETLRLPASNVGDTDLQFFVMQLRRKGILLKELSFEKCEKITDAGVRVLEKLCPTLRVLKIPYAKVTAKTINEQSPLWKINLDVSHSFTLAPLQRDQLPPNIKMTGCGSKSVISGIEEDGEDFEYETAYLNPEIEQGYKENKFS